MPWAIEALQSGDGQVWEDAQAMVSDSIRYRVCIVNRYLPTVIDGT